MTNCLRSLVAVVAVVGFFLVVPGETIASAQAPTITSVSPITAQNDSDLPGGEASGPGIIIAGSGFGATPPTVCQADNDTMLGESAIGRDVLTSNLQIVDTSHFSDQDMGNCSNEPHDDCDVTIGSWSDTQIIVLLDDTGGLDCDDIDNGDNLTVQVFSTDAGNDASNVVSTSAVAEGSVASITGLSPASGPVAGGTFTDSGGTNPNGTITITGSNLAGTTIVWFGNGGDDGAVATTNFTFGTDGLGNPDIIVTPPPAPAGLDEGTDVVLTNAGGTSVVACTAIDEGCEGTYYWQSPSATLPTISGSTGPLDINASLAFNLAIPQKGGACPGSSPAGGTGIGFSATATVTGGPVDFSGQFQTSENDGFLSSIQAPITVTVESPVVVTVNVSGVVSGCYAVPIPDLSIPGLGGVYILIGGNLAVGYTLTATINQGSFVVDAGYVANQVDGAAIVSQNCTDGNGHPLPCVQTSSAGVISGTLDFSPLWLGVDITDIPGLTFSAGAGLTVSAFVTDSTTSGFDYDVCFGGTYAVVGSVGSGPASLSISTTGVFVGPFNIYGDGTQCPLGAIGSGLPSTNVTVSSSDSTVPVGTKVTYTAAVSTGASGGTVSFADGGSPIASCESQPVDASGNATCDQTYSGTGSHSIVATFSGDTAFAGSVSTAFTQQVSGSVTSTTTTLASSANPSTTGQQVTYTATVSPTDNGGPVTFTDGGTPISGCVSIALTNGTAGCAQTYAVPGTHSIVATYRGDTNFGESASTRLTQVVKSSVTTTTTVLTSSANPSAETQQVTYTATVSPSDNGGTVSFSDGGTAISGCQSVALSAGKAECPQTYSSAGSLSIVATYSGDISYGGSKSATLTQVISSSLTATETTLVTSVNPAPLNKTVTYTATVSPTDNGGTVNFTYGGVALPGCTGKTLDSSHQATCFIDWVSGSGTTEIVATYSGDSNYAGSTSNAICQVVGTGARATATTLVGSANRATVGETVIYKATVSPASYGGTVTFSYGGGVLPGCKAVALNSAGQARCGIIWISGGTTSIVAKYSGDTDYAPSTSNSIVQVVIAAFTAKASYISTTYGHAVALSVSGLAANATGTVTFSSPHGSLCKAKVSKGKASCNTGAALVPGDYAVS
ncbi:MAG: Ig-like domain-containing protein, partial [Acidimicrobiales bacterium]